MNVDAHSVPGGYTPLIERAVPGLTAAEIEPPRGGGAGHDHRGSRTQGEAEAEGAEQIHGAAEQCFLR
jgi:hypothetical protein